MTSMRDVALRAGVSESTVSRALSGKIPVTDETRSRVLAAVGELGYQPNLLAQSLRSGSTKLFALVVPDITQPSLATLALAVEEAAHQHGYSLLLCNTLENAEREAQYLTAVVQRWVDGVIISRAQNADVAIALWNEMQIPVVVVDRALASEQLPSVVVDNEQVGRLATEHLLGLGHRVIGCLTTPMRFRFTRERLQGYQSALRQAGIALDPALVVEGPVQAEDSNECARRLLQTRPDITAIYAFSDVRAISCMKVARELGRLIPQDLSVVGTNNTSICTLIDPPLTTVAQPFEAMAKESVDTLVRLAAGKRLRQRHVVLQPELVVRATTSPPRRRDRVAG